MKKYIRNDFIESVCIGLSYILLWVPAVFISVNLNFSEFLKMYGYRTWMNVFVLLSCLFIFHILYPVVKKKRYGIIWVTISILVIATLLTIVNIEWLKLGMRLNTYPSSERSSINNNYVVRSVIFQLYGISYFSIIKLLIRFIKLRARNQQLLVEKKTSELNYLKSQTNPHFLFNTLNGIYSLARDKSDLTADSVMRLSDILRYMLYETQTALISIAKEIEIIEDYIELEKMRYDDSLKVIFEKDIDNTEQQIPPLLLIHLIENAFKHGVSETINSPCILIALTIKANRLLFTVDNSIVNKDTSDELNDNIGLANLRRQLGLLFKEHQLTIKRTESSFLVSLEINLSSYGQN